MSSRVVTIVGARLLYTAYGFTFDELLFGFLSE